MNIYLLNRYITDFPRSLTKVHVSLYIVFCVLFHPFFICQPQAHYQLTFLPVSKVADNRGKAVYGHIQSSS